MKYYISSAFLNTREIVEVAKAADDLGYDGIGIPDHIVDLETLATPRGGNAGRHGLRCSRRRREYRFMSAGSVRSRLDQD